ncbi:MAG: hypothetical protein AB7G93_12675 [Bdellovibrionales bacterium]
MPGIEDRFAFDLTSYLEYPTLLEIDYDKARAEKKEKGDSGPIIIFFFNFYKRIESHLLLPFVANPMMREAWKNMKRPLPNPVHEQLARIIDEMKTEEDIDKFLTNDYLTEEHFSEFLTLMKVFGQQVLASKEAANFGLEKAKINVILASEKVSSDQLHFIIDQCLRMRNVLMAKNIVKITCAIQRKKRMLSDSWVATTSLFLSR